MILNESYILSNGVPIPKLGLGTWFIDDDKAAQAVRDALEIGYRNIDTAQAYGNERGVGEGVRTGGVPRGEMFVSTKLAAEIKNYDDAATAIDGSLATLGLDHVDLMLIHSPQPWNDFRGGDYAEGNLEAWRALEDAHKTGKIRAIGVSNFQQHDLENILGSCTVAPHANQLLVHAGNTPAELIAYCESKEILVEAYSPIALAHRARLHPGEPGRPGDRREVRSDGPAAVHPLHPAARRRLAAQNGEPRAHALQRRSGLRHLQPGHGRPSRPSRPGLRRAQRIPRLQRQVTASPLTQAHH